MKDKNSNNHITTGDPLSLWEYHPSEWQEHKLWDLAEYINGKAFKPTDFSLEGLPVIKITELKYGLSSATHLYSGDYEEKYLLRTGDLLFAWSGNPETSLDAFRWKGKEALLNQHIFRVIPQKNIDKTYLYFLLKYMRSTFIRTARDKATSMGHVKVSDLKRLIAYIPPLPEQKAIASILGALDDKIELNRKMNETLEAMARAIFKSWFVDFDPIPGIGPHKEWQDSPLGRIPKGWRVGKVSDICTTQYGYTASASENEVGPYFLRITDMNKEPWIDWQKVPYCSIDDNLLPRYSLQIGDILVSRMADPGKAAIVEENVNAVFASYLVRLKTKVIPIGYYLFYFLRSEQYLDYAAGAMSGSVQAGMNAKIITAADMLIPPGNIIVNFLKVIHPLRQKITDNLNQSRTIADIRDALLPKLLSGEIRVKNAEMFVERRL